MKLIALSCLTIIASAGILACSSNGTATGQGGLGGANATSGGSSAGGAALGGTHSSGGALANGGSSAQGGNPSMGGIGTTGGSIATGGNTSGAGGNVVATGGSANPTGGAPTVGTTERSAGGAPTAGGSNPTGGTTSDGGASPAAGGSRATGGTTPTGGGSGTTNGTMATGGIAPTGGSGTATTGGSASYVIGAPNTDATIMSACTNSGNVSFACPRFMLFSPEMIQAAADDAASQGWPAESFNYGVAALNGAACCSCYQLVFQAPTNSSLTYPAPPPLIIQNFSLGGSATAFEIFMGKGGEAGQTTGCPQMYTAFPSTGEPNGSGISASSISDCGSTASTLASSSCVSAVATACNGIKASSPYVQSTTRTSCIEANSAQTLYHETWNVKARQVECPNALTEVTGCKPNAGSNPKPDPTIQTASQASGWSSYMAITMQDCCKPSCAWPNKVSNAQSPWSAMYQCGADGSPMHN